MLNFATMVIPSAIHAGFPAESEFNFSTTSFSLSDAGPCSHQDLLSLLYHVVTHSPRTNHTEPLRKDHAYGKVYGTIQTTAA